MNFPGFSFPRQEPLDDTKYEVILVGTGVTQAIIAGALARAGKKILHLDPNPFYGEQFSSFNLEQFFYIINWCKNLQSKENSNVNNNNNQTNVIQNPFKLDNCEEFELEEDQLLEPLPSDDPNVNEPKVEKKFWKKELLKEYRSYNIDLTPKLYFSKGPEVTLLVSSGVYRYLEFKAVENIYIYLDNSLQLVPCSKSDVFKSLYLSLLEKRYLSKFMSFVNTAISTNMNQPSKEEEQTNEENNNNNNANEVAEKINQVKDTSFVEFLKSQNLSPKLISFILYAISMITTDISSKETTDITVAQGLELMKKYLLSLGIYSSTPYLASLYGSSDLTQAFCRLSAVFGGLYILHRGVISVRLEENKFASITEVTGQNLTSQYLVIGADYTSEYVLAKKRRISRCVCITDSSLAQTEGVIFSVIPPSKCGNRFSIKVVQFDSGMSVAPKNKFVVYFFCDSDLETARADLENAVKLLIQFPNQETQNEDNSRSDLPKKPRGLYCVFYNQEVAIPDTSKLPEGVFVCNGPDSSVDCDMNLQEAREIFHKMFPNEEFLPRAPTSDEIVYDGGVDEENVPAARDEDEKTQPTN